MAPPRLPALVALAALTLLVRCTAGTSNTDAGPGADGTRVDASRSDATPTDANTSDAADGAAVDVAPPDPCAAHATCGDCTAQANCGFCRTAGTCHTGTTQGPTDQACASTDWAWTAVQCDPCTSHTDCSACVSSSGCGWCADTMTCESGAMGGPAPTSASCSRFWDFGSSLQCPGPAAGYGSCTTCDTAGPMYGWCQASMQCFLANATNTYPASGDCSGGFSSNWGDCADPCFANTDCSSCLNASGCGWCNYGGTGHGACLSDSGNGAPANGATCDSWSTSSCP